MAEYLALTYTADVDWWAPEQADELAEYRQFAVRQRRAIRRAPSCTRPARQRSSGSRAPAAAR